jgi:hypothetical protein
MADTDYYNMYRYRNKGKNKLVPVFKKSALYYEYILENAVTRIYILDLNTGWR